MNIPKVKFTNIPLSKEVDWIHGFLFQNEWGWGKYIIKKYPKLKKVFSFKVEEEQIKFLRNCIIQLKKDNQKLIEKNKIKYQTEWQKIEKEFFVILSEIIQTDWPKHRKVIKAMISINPICPRFLNDWSFSIFYNYKKMSPALEVIMHESCHFLYFEKWKNLYPKMNKKQFESPHVEWHLSEILAPIILNDNRIQKLLQQKAFFYEEYKKLKINGKIIPKYFSSLYEKNKKRQKKFHILLQKSYKIIKNNRKLFENNF